MAKQSRKLILLEDLEKKEGFQTPAGYFDQLPGTISQRLQTERANSIRFTPGWVKYAAAIAIACLVGMGVWYRQSTSQSGSEQVAADLTEQQVVDYLHAQAEVNPEELLDWMDADQLVTENQFPADFNVPEEILLDEADLQQLDEGL